MNSSLGVRRVTTEYDASLYGRGCVSVQVLNRVEVVTRKRGRGTHPGAEYGYVRIPAEIGDGRDVAVRKLT